MKALAKTLIRMCCLLFGDFLAWISRATGKLAASSLFFAQWRLSTPEWFDGRLTLLSPKRWGNDLHHIVYSNVLQVLPLGGRVLDICSGDAFIPYYIYSRRADQIVCVDYNSNAARHAMRYHSAPGIQYQHRSIFDFEGGGEPMFDVVVIRGAIEHFTQQQQQAIFSLAKRVLKPGGYFCGDTPANQKNDKLLESHEYEWRDEAQMREELSHVFDDIQTQVYVNREPVNGTTLRTSLIWRCRKQA
jgi:SAM-dependent methyltransferase